MHRNEILAKLRQIAQKLDLPIESLDADEVKAKINAARIAAIGELNALREQLHDDNASLAFLYAMLIDADAITSSKATVGFFASYADGMLRKHPALPIFVNKLRQVPLRLLKFLFLISSISLSEMVREAKLESIDDAWLDPYTGKVMDIPVTFYVDGKAHTLDLFTLLLNSDNSFGLRTPTRQYIYLHDLYPNLAVVQAILNVVLPLIATKMPIDHKEELQKALLLIKANDIVGLKKWWSDNYEIDLNQQFVFTQSTASSLLHEACRLNNFDAAIWLAEQGAFVTNADEAGQMPGDLLNPQLLDAAIATHPENYGLRFLKAATQYRPVPPKDKTIYLENLVLAAQNGFIPAMFINGSMACINDQPSVVIYGIGQLRATLRLNTGYAAEMLCDMYELVISKKPALLAALEAAHNDTDALNKKTLVRDLLALLASDAYILNRRRLEEKVAIMLRDLTNSNRTARGYDIIKAFCLAIRTNLCLKTGVADQLLIDILKDLGLVRQGQEIMSQMTGNQLWKHLTDESSDARKIFTNAKIDDAVENGSISFVVGSALKARPYIY